MADTALVTGASGVTVTCLCPGPTGTGFQDRAGMRDSRLFQNVRVMSAADVARRGYAAMMAGRAVVVPGMSNEIRAQMVRVGSPALVRRFVTRLQDRR